MAAVHDKMDAALLTLNVNSNEMLGDVISQSKSDADKMPTAKSTSSDMQLDKFKRRLVRAVARYRQQKMPEDDMWRELKKEVGCDCKMLWQHMRALTLKKLKRLLPANDMLANITKVARFTATDWLLFDLILVHENIDVISVNDQQDKSDYTQEEKPECITELFELVVKHKVEGLMGDELTEAWIRVTLDYNSRGRQCSPMLLQLRWYQMKEMSRAVFYNFWYSYRGTKKYLEQAMAIKPTELQSRIVRQYDWIITNHFPKWEQLIEDRRIILSEEFAITRKGLKTEKPREEKEIELIETQVETIDLASDETDKNDDISPSRKASDHGDHNSTDLTANYDSNKDNKTDTNTVSIKSEPQDDEVLDLDGLSDVEATYITLEQANSHNIPENLCKNSTTEIINLENEIDDENVLLPTITSVISSATESDKANSEDELNEILEQKAKDLKNIVAPVNPYTEIENTEITDVIECDPEDEMDRILCEKANNLMNIEITQVESEYDNMEPNMKITNEDTGDESTFKNDISSINSEPIQCDSDEEINNLINEKAEKFMSNDVVQTGKTNDMFPNISNISENSVNTVSEEPSTTLKLKLEIDIENDNDIIRNDANKEKNNDAFDERNFEDDGIEFVDDGIEFVDDECNEKNEDIKSEIESSNDSGENEKNMEENDVPKIDLKLLMDPKVFTKKLDLMEVFKFTDYHNVNDKRVIECALSESKPVDRLCVTEEDIKKFREEALLGHKTDGSQEHDDSEQSDDEFADNRVKSTSWLLQKPKNRSYNPIQLCKNPDFNTRLKRLTVGFLKMTRNRILLKECKPLTIDLHKAFETKLVNGTIYLKGCDFKSAKTCVPEINYKDLVTPSVIPGQSILNSETDKSKYLNQALSQNFEITENSSQSLPKVQCSMTVASERSKVIKLPDIDQVRRVNQGLLTAEVTPIRVDSNMTDVNIRKQANMSTPPPSNPVLIAAKGKSKVDSMTQVKSEVPHIDKNSNKSNIMPEKVKHPSMSKKINDKVLPVDTKKHQGVKGDKKIKNYTFSSRETLYTPVCKENVTWSAKYVSNYYADSLLTNDTLNKILYLLEMDDTVKKTSAESTQSELQKNKDITKQNTTSSEDYKKDSDVEASINKQQSLNQKRRKRQLLPKPYAGAFCCWAREKLIYININRPVKGHGCLKFSCKCCCRKQLNKMQMKIYDIKKRDASSSKVPHAEDTSDKTIILSDDEGTCKHKASTTCTNEIEKESEQVNNSEVVNTSVFLSSLKTDDLINLSPMTDKITSNLGDISDNAVDPSTSVLLPSLKTDDLINVSPMTDEISSNLGDVSNNAVDPSTNKLVKTSNDYINVLPPLIATKSILSANKVQFTDNRTKNKFTDASNKKRRCKPTVIPAKGHPYEESLQPFVPQLQSTTETTKIMPMVKTRIPSTTVPPPLTTISPSVVVSEKANKSSVCFINNRLKNKHVKNPIFLGLNKILLCSLPNTTLVLPQLPALPEGVSFMLLPDGVLTLGISSVVEIHPHQICALPPMMAIIQEELRKNSSVFAGPNNENTQLIQENKAEEHSNMDVEHIPPSETNNLNDNCDITECIDSTQIENTQQNIETQSIDKSCQNNEDVPHTQNNSKNENREADSEQIVQGQETIDSSVQVEIQTVEPQSTKENQADSAVATEDTAQSSEQCPKINREESRKTILSDLMEMSGISTEDTGMIPNSSMVPNMNDILSEPENALPAAHVLPPNIIPIIRVSSSNLTQKTVAPDITIAGPYSNLLSFEPINSTNILLNYLGQIRPELNAVTSFPELKYVCDNNGEFYKLDVETGSIVGINVCLKKKSSILPSMPSGSKDVIDLTDDVGDDDILHDITQTDNDPSAQQDEQDISFEFYSQGKEPSVVKPLKLFKAVRLPQNFKGRSIIKPNILKKNTQVSSNTDLLFMDIPTNLGTNESCVPSQLDSSYDSSDDEPLAKKSKRMKTSNKNDEEIVPAPDLPDTSEIGGDDSDMSVVEMNNMDIEGVNPELHPVVFEEGSESEDDMCILGV